jgi:hypothetical protein
MACFVPPLFIGGYMITYVHLQDFLDKCRDALQQTQEEYQKRLEKRKHIDEDIRISEDQIIAIEAQILTIEQLMDVEANPPKSELPFAGDDIEELFDKRLEGSDGATEEELLEQRQEVYKAEALDQVEMIDALNKETASGEDAEGDS